MLLQERFFSANGTGVSRGAIEEALDLLQARALWQGPKLEVAVRVAGDMQTVYVDLGDADGVAVEVKADGWRLTARPPVRFWRPAALLPLPQPDERGTFDELWPFLNVEAGDRPLLAAWLTSAFWPRGPYPVLNLFGEQGSGKSTTSRVLRDIVDPNAAPVRAEPRNERDLMIAATNGRVVALDNLSRVQSWLSDALCRLSTGGALATRELYTDAEEVLLRAQRPVILNSIAEVATRSDLLDRSLIAYHPAIRPTARRTEEEFWAQFDSARPRILGALFTAVSTALRNWPSVSLDRLPRLADFAKMAVAAEPAFGLSGGFIEAFEESRTRGTGLALEASPIYEPVLSLIESDDWSGTATDLLELLTERVDPSLTRRRAWPGSAQALSSAVRRIAPELRSAGVEIEHMREAGGRRRLIEIRRAADRAPERGVTDVTRVTDPWRGARLGDERDACDADDSGLPLRASPSGEREHRTL